MEADAVAEDILNVHQVQTRYLMFSVVNYLLVFCQLKWESIDEVDEDTRVMQSLSGFWPEDTSFMDGLPIQRDVKGELCEDIVRIKKKIKAKYRTYEENEHSIAFQDMQNSYKTSSSVRESISASASRNRSALLSAWKTSRRMLITTKRAVLKADRFRAMQSAYISSQ